jgi:multidrug efflux pump subunit AcrB
VPVRIARERVPTAALPRLEAYATLHPPADIVSQILNFGLPAPVDVQVTGPGRFGRENFRVAQEITHRLREVPGAVDVTLKQVLDAPQFNGNVDRQGAALLGLSESDVANSLLVSLSSSSQTSRNYWVNPKNGVDYLVAIQTRSIRSTPSTRCRTRRWIPAAKLRRSFCPIC